MNLSDLSQPRLRPGAAIDAFLAVIEPFRAAYQDASFSFLAVAKADGMHIVKGRLTLDPLQVEVAQRSFRTTNVLAAAFSLAHNQFNFEAFLRELAIGRIGSPFGDLWFDHSDDPSAVVLPLHMDGIAAQARLSTMHIAGNDQISYIQQPDIDWELRGATTPYHSLDELLGEFGLGAEVPIRGALIEVVAGQIAAVDYSAWVRRSLAIPRINASRFLDRSRIGLGLRIEAPGQRPERRSLSGSELLWRDSRNRPNVVTGRARISVPENAVVWCYLTYDGIAVHFGWIASRLMIPNVRRATIEAFDPGMQITKELLFSEVGTGKKGQKNDMEDAVASIAYALGFAVSQIGRNNRTEDAVDLLATAPSGNIFLIECTRGLLKAENKLANLIQRTAQVRRRIAQSWSSNARVLPLMITTLTKDEVAVEMRQAELDGVRVLTREDLDSDWHGRTRFQVNADAMFVDAEQYLNRIHTNHETRTR